MKSSAQHKPSQNAANDVTFYDKYNYDYSTYWTSRSYEHEAEVYALKTILHDSSGDWFVDIGGSYGRHIPIYQGKYAGCVLLDYSLNSLRQASDELTRQNITTVFPVAANAYHLPFQDNVFEGGMMIRVLHHIENPDAALDEIIRTFRDRGRFVLEFPNKLHAKSVIKAIARGDTTYLSSPKPVQVQTIKPEGSCNADPGIMLNFAPKHIRNLLSNRNVTITSSTAISFLRMPIFKKLIGTKALVQIEKVLQKILGNTTLTPSIIFSTEIHKKATQPIRTGKFLNLRDILACPSCAGKLSFSSHTYTCTSCSLSFPIQYGIPDLRYPQEHLQ